MVRSNGFRSNGLIVPNSTLHSTDSYIINTPPSLTPPPPPPPLPDDRLSIVGYQVRVEYNGDKVYYEFERVPW